MQASSACSIGRRFLDLRAQSDAVADAPRRRRPARAGRGHRAADGRSADGGAAHRALRRRGRLEEVRARLSELTLAVDRHQGRSALLQGADRGDGRARRPGAGGGGRSCGRAWARWPSTSTSARADEARLRIERAAAEDEARRRPRRRRRRRRRASRASRSGAGRRPRRPGRPPRPHRRARRTRASRSAGTAARAAADLLKLAAETAELETRARARRGPAARPRASGRRRRRRCARSWRRRARTAPTRGAAARTDADAAAREAEGLQSERDGLAGRLASLEEMVATHSAFDEGVRALLAATGRASRVLGVVADAVETDSALRARGGGVPGRPPAGRAHPGRRGRAARHPLPAGNPAPAAAPSCPSPPRAPRPTARPCATWPRRSRRRAACSATSTA